MEIRQPGAAAPRITPSGNRTRSKIRVKANQSPRMGRSQKSWLGALCGLLLATTGLSAKAQTNTPPALTNQVNQSVSTNLTQWMNRPIADILAEQKRTGDTNLPPVYRSVLQEPIEISPDAARRFREWIDMPKTDWAFDIGELFFEDEIRDLEFDTKADPRLRQEYGIYKATHRSDPREFDDLMSNAGLSPRAIDIISKAGGLKPIHEFNFLGLPFKLRSALGADSVKLKLDAQF